MRRTQLYLIVCVVIILGALALFIYASPAATALFHTFKSTAHFHPLDTDHRVLYEPGAERFAEVVAKELPASIETVEKAQFGHFTKSIKIYVCATTASFKNMTGGAVRAKTFRGSVFLSPRLLEHPEAISSYLTHELSHLLLLQYMGLYKMVTTPPWFTEGLAVLVSKGGGAAEVTEEEAVQAISSGKHFEPYVNGGLYNFLFPKYGGHWGLKPHMFYRQSMLFVSFMKDYDKKAFKNLLLNLQNGQNFAKSFQSAYNTSIKDIWYLFLKHLRA